MPKLFLKSALLRGGKTYGPGLADVPDAAAYEFFVNHRGARPMDGSPAPLDGSASVRMAALLAIFGPDEPLAGGYPERLLAGLTEPELSALADIGPDDAKRLIASRDADGNLTAELLNSVPGLSQRIQASILDAQQAKGQPLTRDELIAVKGVGEVKADAILKAAE